MRISLILSLSVWTIWTLISIFFFEKILLNNGLGYDGQVYGDMVKYFPGILTDKQLNIYYVYRILPSILVWCGLKLCDLPITDNYIVAGFHFLNYISIIISIFLWYKISVKIKFSNIAFIFGLVLMLINFAFFKHVFYNPVLTDAFALMLGMCMLYIAIRNKPLLQIPAIIISRFVWPIGIYSGFIMLLAEVKQNLLHQHPLFVKRIATIGRILVYVSCIICLVYGLFIFKQFKPNTKYLINFQYLILSIPFVFGYLFCILRLPVESLITKVRVDKWYVIAVAFIVAALLILVRVPVELFADKQAYTITPASVVYLSYLRAVERPAIFMVAHLSYFGALAFFMIVYWGSFKNTFAHLSPAVGFLVFVHLIFAVNSETRFLILALPFFVYWAVLVFEKVANKKIILWAYLIVGLVTSKFWLQINVGLDAQNYLSEGVRYYISFGPWMSNYYYIVQLILSAIILLILFLISQKTRAEHAFK